MSRPTEKELETALEHAAWLREKGKDEFFMGKSLLNHNYRITHLERVLSAVKRYLHSGMTGASELTALQKAIEAAEKADARPGETAQTDNRDVTL